LCLDVSRKKTYKNFDLTSLECPDPAYQATNGIKESQEILDRKDKELNLTGFILRNAQASNLKIVKLNSICSVIGKDLGIFTVP